MEKNPVTPEFRVSYPKVFKPETNTLSGKQEYSIQALFTKAQVPLLKELQNAVKEAIAEKWGSDQKKWPPNIRTPFRKHEDRMKEGQLPIGMEAGGIFITLKSAQKPGLVDQNVKPILDETQFYGGCYARATVRAYAYANKGNTGVSLGLVNIQKTRDGDPLGSRARPEDDFEPVTDVASEDVVGSSDDLDFLK